MTGHTEFGAQLTTPPGNVYMHDRSREAVEAWMVRMAGKDPFQLVRRERDGDTVGPWIVTG